MADFIRFAGLLLPILLGFIWAVAAGRSGKRKLVCAGVAGAIGGAVIFVADIVVEFLPPSFLVFRAALGGAVGAAAGLLLWALASRRGIGRAVYAGVAGAIAGACICDPGVVLVAIPMLVPAVYCAIVGTVVGAIAGLIVGLPAGLIYLHVRRSRRKQGEPLRPGTAGSPSSRDEIEDETGQSEHRLRTAVGAMDSSILLVVGFVSVSMWLLALNPETCLPLPAFEDVVSIKAPIDPRKQQGMFEIPKACRADIYSALLPCNEDLYPAEWIGIGDLRIESKDGSVYDVDVYQTGESVGAFSVATSKGRSYFRGGSENKFKKALAKAYSGRQRGDEPPAESKEHR
jgi:hypothetical protein